MEPPSGQGDRDYPIELVAEQVAEAATETGLGFLFAKLVTDRIVEGSIDPESSNFQSLLYGQAAELLLDDPDRSSTDRALLQAASAVDVRGIPVGAAWEVSARAIDHTSSPGVGEQLDLVRRLGRLLVEEQVEGEVLYRLFHPFLQAHFRDGLWTDQVLSKGSNAEKMRSVAAALVELQKNSNHRFLDHALPGLLARVGDRKLSTDAAAVFDGWRQRIVKELIAISQDATARGDGELAMDRARQAGDLARTRRTQVDVLLAFSEINRVFGDWRTARDQAREAHTVALEMHDTDPSETAAAGFVVRSTNALVSALGVGFHDAEDGLELADDTLDYLSTLNPEVLRPLAGEVADLLMVYPRFLGEHLTPTEQLLAAASAHAIFDILVTAGSHDREPDRILAMCFEGACRLDTGDARGLDLLELGVEASLSDAPARGLAGLDSVAMAGELTQRLGIEGLHRRALHWVNRGLAVWEQILEAYGTETRAGTVVAQGLMMRSVVYSVLGNEETALEDAFRAAKLVGTQDAIVPLASCLIDTGLVHDLFVISDGLPEPFFPSVPWWQRFARSEELIQQGRIEPAIELLQRTLDSLGRFSAPPSPRILFAEFIDYEPELRTAAQLSRAWRLNDGSAAARIALEQGARAFLGRVGLRTPRSLLHVNPGVLEAFGQIWSGELLPEGQHQYLADEWRQALEILGDAGREALASRYRNEPLLGETYMSAGEPPNEPTIPGLDPSKLVGGTGPGYDLEAVGDRVHQALQYMRESRS